MFYIGYQSHKQGLYHGVYSEPHPTQIRAEIKKAQLDRTNGFLFEHWIQDNENLNCPTTGCHPGHPAV